MQIGRNEHFNELLQEISPPNKASFQTERGPGVSPTYITITRNKGEKERIKIRQISEYEKQAIQCK